MAGLPPPMITTRTPFFLPPQRLMPCFYPLTFVILAV